MLPLLSIFLVLGGEEALPVAEDRLVQNRSGRMAVLCQPRQFGDGEGLGIVGHRLSDFDAHGDVTVPRANRHPIGKNEWRFPLRRLSRAEIGRASCRERVCKYV